MSTKYAFLLFTFWRYCTFTSFFKDKGFSYFFCLIIERSRSGSVQIMTDPDPGGKKNMCIILRSGSTTLPQVKVSYLISIYGTVCISCFKVVTAHGSTDLWWQCPWPPPSCRWPPRWGAPPPTRSAAGAASCTSSGPPEPATYNRAELSQEWVRDHRAVLWLCLTTKLCFLNRYPMTPFGLTNYKQNMCVVKNENEHFF